jgi:hypothetical protein
MIELDSGMTRGLSARDAIGEKGEEEVTIAGLLKVDPFEEIRLGCGRMQLR